MYFVLQTPSLQHLAGVKIVTTLWSQRDIYDFREGLKAMEEKVKTKISVLPILELCRNPLFNFIKPVGVEFMEWRDYYNDEDNNFQVLDKLSPRQLCWTMHGTVDYKKTAELMLKDERLSVERRYEIACVNCLEEEARELLKSIDEERRRELIKSINAALRWENNNGDQNFSGWHRAELITFFTYTLSGDDLHHLNDYFKERLGEFKSIIEYLFVDTLHYGNRATCEYLFAKLSPREKEHVLFECQEDVLRSTPSPTGNMLYYLSQMNAEHREFALAYCLKDILIILLGWPTQSLFVETANCEWEYFEFDDGNYVMQCITYEFRFDFQDFDYSHLFWEFWRLSPPEYRQHYLGDDEVVDNLLLTEREEFMKLILNEAPSHQMEKSFNKIRQVLMNESVISDAALTECKQTALLNSSIDEEEDEKEENRMRREHVSRLVDTVMESRTKSREKCI